MIIYVNNVAEEIALGGTVADIIGENKLAIIDGFAVDSDYRLAENDRILLIEKDSLPDREIYSEMVQARNGREVNSKLKNACVAICGLGGLGSNIAVALARLGVGSLTLIDCDRVDPTNINRQCYYISDIGKEKSIAMSERIANINPYIEVRSHNVRLCRENILKYIGNADIVVEAFDGAESKAMLVDSVLSNTQKYVVASSGMAGYGSANDIVTKRVGKRLYIVGDGVSEAKVDNGLMSPRVMVCAGHQANEVLRIIMGIMEA